MKTIKVTGYSHWASYLINGDASGLEQDDVVECNEWLEFNGLHEFSAVDVSESYFGTPDMRNALKGDVSEYTFLKNR